MRGMVSGKVCKFLSLDHRAGKYLRTQGVAPEERHPAHTSAALAEFYAPLSYERVWPEPVIRYL